MLKRRLALDLPTAQAVDSMTWRALMRAGAEQGLIQDVDDQSAPALLEQAEPL
jgi:hypothetical protein